MRFHYVAADQWGKVNEGDIEAKDPLEVLNYIGTQNLRPISVRPLSETLKAGQKLFAKKTITLSDKIFLTKYLSLMLRVGTDLFKAIDILIADFDKLAIKSLLTEIRSNLEQGQPFYVTFSRYPKQFSPIFVNLIKAGESSGNLDRVFSDLSTSLEKEKDLRGRVRGALIYPAILLVLSFFILLFLVSFAVPKIAGVFSGGGFNPPLFSRIVFAVGLFIGAHIVAILGIVFGVAFGAYYFFRWTLTGKKALAWIFARTPVVRTLLTRIALQRFAATLSSLMSAGLPILESLEIVADAVGNNDIQLALRRVAREGIARGSTIGESFKREAAFPAVVTNLIAVSEKAGHLDEILKTLAQFYDAEIDTALKTMIAFIEPVLLLFIGGIVGLIALSLIVPIYQLVGQVGA